MRLRALSVSSRFMILYLLGFGALLLGGSVLQYNLARRQAVMRVEAAGLNLLQVLQEVLQERPDLFTGPSLQAILLRFDLKVADVSDITVVDAAGRVVARSRPGQTAMTAASADQLKALGERREVRRSFAVDGSEFLRLSRVLTGRYDPRRHSNVLGAVSIELGLGHVNAEAAADLGVALLATVLMLGVVGVGLYLATRHLFVTPLKELAAAGARFSQGDLTARVVPRSDDEIGRLAVVFNETISIVASDQDILRAARDAATRAKVAGENVQSSH